jgi:hypothetical protein
MLRWRVSLALAFAFAVPFLFVEIPPLGDIPGHIGAFAMQVAPPGSPLSRDFAFEWKLTLNMASQLAMEVLYRPLGVFAATWLLSALSPVITVIGMIAVSRRLNPVAPASMPWSMLFIYNVAFLMGFLNFTLSAGLALCAFAAWISLDGRKGIRAAFFLLIVPALTIAHAQGGAFLVLWISSWELWRVAGWRPGRWSIRLAGEMGSRLWPLGAAVVPVLLSASGPGPTTFPVFRKFGEILATVHDQNAILDISTVIAALVVLAFGLFRGARYSNASAGPVIATAALFLVAPGRLSGTDFVDLRIAPYVLLLALALLDWRKIEPRIQRWVMLVGVLLLTARLCVTAASFVTYQRDYDAELVALEKVRPNSRVMNLSFIDCDLAGWRSPRTEHLANLATPLRNAWTNAHWALPNIHMLQIRFQPGDYARDPSHLVRPDRCVDYGIPFEKRARHGLAETMQHIPLQGVDYLWLIGLQLPKEARDDRLVRIWGNGRSELYEVRRRSGSGL